MLFGALLVFAPGAAAAHWTDEDTNPGGNDNPSCEDLGYDIEAKDNTERNAPYSGTASGDGLIVDYTLNADGTVDFVVDLDGDEPDSEYAVSAVIIKKGDEASGGGAHVFEYDPATLSDEGLQTIPAGATSFSHITFCGGELPVEDYDCPDGTTAVESNGEEGIQEEECVVDDYDCPDGTTAVESNGEEGIQEEECVEIEDNEETPPVKTCPIDTKHTDVNGDGVVQDTECVEVKDSTKKPVVKPTTQPTPQAVLGAQTNRALAATGSGSDTLTTVGVALIMFGAVLSLGSRRRVRYLR